MQHTCLRQLGGGSSYAVTAAKHQQFWSDLEEQQRREAVHVSATGTASGHGTHLSGVTSSKEATCQESTRSWYARMLPECCTSPTRKPRAS